MLKSLLFLFTCTVIHCSDLMLEGTLGEFYGEPVTVHCDNDKGYIRLGGITINNDALTTAEAKGPMQQCEKQMKKIEENRKDILPGTYTGTDCVLTFPKMSVNSTDVIRIVYKCYDFRPSGSPPWSKAGGQKKAETKTMSIKKKGQIRVRCTAQDEMIFISKATINDVITSHPDLEPEKLTRDCFRQWKERLDKGPGSEKPCCYIENKTDYGGELEITYSCLNKGKEPNKVNSRGKPRGLKEE